MESDDEWSKTRALEEENARLRSQVSSTTKRRRAAATFFLVAIGLFGATWQYPAQRTILIALAGTSLFGSILIVGLEPDRKIPSIVIQSVLESVGSDRTELIAKLGFDGSVRYVPRPDGGAGLRVGSTHNHTDGLPNMLDSKLIERDDSSELSLTPVGNTLLRQLEANAGELPDDVRSALPTLYQGVTELFRLADTVETSNYEDSEESPYNKLTIRISGIVVGDPTVIDSPVISLIGVGIANVVDRPVTAETTVTDNENTLVTFRWKNQ